MGIMNVAWPVTALFGSVLILWSYFTYGRLATHERAHAAMERGETMPHKTRTPFPAMVGKGDLHCGSGCALGDLVAETLVFLVPAVATWFGWQRPCPLPGLWAAVKADTASLTAWQVGMYGFMAFAQFYLFRRVLGTTLEVNSVEFWFMMQIVMIAGFATSYPVNWWLLKAGLKEKM